MILCATPHAQYLAKKAEIDEAIHRVLDRGHYILGEEVKAFEAEFARYLGVKHAVGVANGTDAIQIALAALGIGRGDEVITVAHTAVATVTAIVQAGATPVLVDIDPETYTLDPSQLERACSSRTKAVVAVHLYGQPADLDSILGFTRKRGLRLIEDCAQAHGARFRGRRVGGFGDAAAFSFYPTKNLGALGDGGAVVFQEDDWAHRARLIRQYGWAERYVSHIHGWNSRLDELQAAVLRTKLVFLDDENQARQRLSDLYREGLEGASVGLPRIRDGAESVYHLFVVSSPDRDRLQAHLQDSGVQTLIHYPVPIHLQPAYRELFPGVTLPVTESAARQVLSLPMHPYLKASEAETVIQAVRKFPGGGRK